MSSLLQGFECDIIFISYRRKDILPTPRFHRQAKEGWVTDFVDALNTELEATFKEEITIYFDEKPARIGKGGPVWKRY